MTATESGRITTDTGPGNPGSALPAARLLDLLRDDVAFLFDRLSERAGAPPPALLLLGAGRADAAALLPDGEIVDLSAADAARLSDLGAAPPRSVPLGPGDLLPASPLPADGERRLLPLGGGTGAFLLVTGDSGAEEAELVDTLELLTRQIRTALRIARLAAAQAPLRSLLERTPDGVLILDARDRVVDRNPCADRMLGPDEGTIRRLLADRPDPSVPRFETTLGEGAERRDLEVTAVDLRVGGLPYTAFVLRDVTAQRAAARQEIEIRNLLVAAKRDWEQTLDSIRDLIFLVDPKGRVVRVNRAVREHLGLDFPEILGRPIREFVGERCAAVATAPPRPTAVAEPVVVPGLSGVFEVSAYPRIDPDAAAAGTVLVLADVSEKIHLREQLLHSEKLSALGELISGIAHELNNPLTAVLGYAQILELRDDGRFAKELTHLKDESMRASRIVRNLLTFARRRESRRAPEDLNDLVRKTVALREYDLRVRNIAVDLDLAPEMPRSMMDRSQLQQVVLNLLNNAEYAIHTVADSGRIRVATRAEDGWILLSVEDDGPGIGREVARRAFDPFFTTKPVGKGSGLGLSICFGIIDDHGGEIRLDPELGRGARFDVRLPVTRWRPDDEELPRDRAAAGAEPAGAAARRRVLFVDDEEAIRLLGREYLGSLGHEVVLAEDGAAALGKLERYEFDIVLCDCRMPRMDGEQFYRTAVERSPRYRDRFVFMTGDAGTTVSGFREGVGRCPVIAKPFDLEELRRILSR